jgi:hypothetical protein
MFSFFEDFREQKLHEHNTDKHDALLQDLHLYNSALKETQDKEQGNASYMQSRLSLHNNGNDVFD